VLRERASGAYYVSAYYVAKMMAEMTVQMFFPLLFSCIVYFLVGFQVQHKRSLIISQVAIR
jgi:ATP-binding cassette subfamily G (WHITE) protein 2